MATETTSRHGLVRPEERCEEDGCHGARLEGRHCLEHVTAEEWDAAIIRLRAGDGLDARGTTISTERLKALLEALKDDAGSGTSRRPL